MKHGERLKAVRRTLEEIDVRGRGNIDKMLGCMMLLDQIIAEESRPHGGQRHAHGEMVGGPLPQ